MKLKPINFMADNSRYRQMLVTHWSYDTPYNEIKLIMQQRGYYLPEEQWTAFKTLLDIQMQLLNENNGSSVCSLHS